MIVLFRKNDKEYVVTKDRRGYMNVYLYVPENLSKRGRQVAFYNSEETLLSAGFILLNEEVDKV